MIISHSKNFIFIRVPKNASTSLATFFVKNYTNKNDIYTGIGDSKIETCNISQKIINKHKTQHRFIHLTLNEIINEGLITAEGAKQKKIIGVIRHPLERQLSLFFFKNKRNSNKSVEAFREEFKNGYHVSDGSNHILQTDYLKIGDEIHGDYWLYENINEELNKFISYTGKYPQHGLQNFKSKFKPKDNDLIDRFYDKKTRNAVLDYFYDDLDMYERLKR